MKSRVLDACLLLSFLMAVPRPAYANDVPEPDGFLSLFMIFPVVILGFRLAGAQLTEKQRRRRIRRGIFLGLAALLPLAGFGLWAIGMLVLVGYGMLRGFQVMRRGQGWKRFAAGLAVILFTAFAVANCLASLTSYIRESPRVESTAKYKIGEIVSAETQFRAAAVLDTNKNGVGEFGTIRQLVNVGLLSPHFLQQNSYPGYRYVLVLSNDPNRAEKEFFIYAAPEHYGWYGVPLLPGSSLWAAVRPPLRARRTFASDETGVIRAADLGTSRAVTREETQKWQPLQSTETPLSVLPESAPPAPAITLPPAAVSVPAGTKAGMESTSPRDELKYVWIPPGSFAMGCSPADPECGPDEKPSHLVTISKGFWLGQTPVTVAAYRRYSGATGIAMPTAPDFNSGWKNQEMPIVNVSWDDAVAYCAWAGGRLPTEAEWEYAARAGSRLPRYGWIDEVAWYLYNTDRGTHDVAQKRPNAFNLYDMLGNVAEWVNDWYGEGYYAASPARDPRGPATGDFRVLRGGGWADTGGGVRASQRVRFNPGNRSSTLGFRCVGNVGSP